MSKSSSSEQEWAVARADVEGLVRTAWGSGDSHGFWVVVILWFLCGMVGVFGLPLWLSVLLYIGIGLGMHFLAAPIAEKKARKIAEEFLK